MCNNTDFTYSKLSSAQAYIHAIPPKCQQVGLLNGKAMMGWVQGVEDIRILFHHCTHLTAGLII